MSIQEKMKQMRWLLSRKVIISLVVLVILAVLGYKIWFSPQENLRTEWETRGVEMSGIGKMLNLAGIVRPLTAWKVTSLTSAKIRTITVKDGYWVTKGQLLIGLDEDELTVKRETARVGYFRAQNRLKEVQNWHSSPTYIDAKATLQTNGAECETKEQEYTQNQQLYAAKAISKQDLDRSKLELDRARADLDKSKAQMTEIEEKGGPQALKEAQAEFNAAKLGLREAEENLANKDIRAPATGIVSFSRSGGQVGKGSPGVETTLTERSSVSPGQVLFEIQSHEDLAVDVYINEYDVFNVHIDQPCFISLPAMPEAGFPGKVASVTTEVSDKITAFKVRCQIMKPDSPPAGGSVKPSPTEKDSGGSPERGTPNLAGEKINKPDQAEQHIKVGMTAYVGIPLERKDNVLVIPVSALVKREGRTGVFLMRMGKPVFRQVKVGIVSQGEAEIIEGLDKGQEVLEEIPEELLDKLDSAPGESR